MDSAEKYIDCLIADFHEIKNEIRRRSTLQRFALLAYATVLAFTFKQFASNDGPAAYWVAALWISSFLALLYYYREGLEIRRLGRIIARHISVNAAGVLGSVNFAEARRVEVTEIFHSETNAGIEPIDRQTSCYNDLFNWIVFFGLPFLATLWIVWAKFGSLVYVDISYLVGAFLIGADLSTLECVCLLCKRPTNAGIASIDRQVSCYNICCNWIAFFGLLLLTTLCIVWMKFGSLIPGDTSYLVGAFLIGLFAPGCVCLLCKRP